MPDKSIRGSIDGERRRLKKVCRENSEYLARVHQVFEPWEVEHEDHKPTPVSDGRFRRWLASKFKLSAALPFDLRLSGADRRLLREIGIKE